MTRTRHFRLAAFAAIAAVMWTGAQAQAAQCGSGAGGFETWKRQFSEEAKGKVGPAAISALMGTSYAYATISADRGLKSFKLSLDQFMAKRGGAAIIARGRALKQSNAALFASIQSRYGVPPGPLLAIWGMETAFGTQHGNQNVLSAVASLAYDCRRPEFFTDQLYAALDADRSRRPLRRERAVRCTARSARRNSCPRPSGTTASAASRRRLAH